MPRQRIDITYQYLSPLLAAVEEKESVFSRRGKLLPVQLFTASDGLPSHICVSSFALMLVFVPLLTICIIDLPRIVQDLQKAKRNILGTTQAIHTQSRAA
jgi:hypothetical protein